MSLEVFIKCDNCDKKIELNYDRIRRGLEKSPVSNWLFEDIYNEEAITLHFCNKECRAKKLIAIGRANRINSLEKYIDNAII